MNEGVVELRIGQLLRRTWGIYKDNVLLIVLIGIFIFWLPPELILCAITLPENKLQAFNLQNIVGAPFAVISSALFTALGLAAQSGERPSFGRLINAIGDRWAAYLGLTIISNGLMVVGLLLFIVPGLFAMVALSLSASACIAERLSAGDALSRSNQLTKGHRWKIFGVALVCLGIFFAIVFTVAFIAALAVNGFLNLEANNAEKLYDVIGGVLVSLILPSIHIFGTVLYCHITGRTMTARGQHVSEIFE